MNFFLPSSYSVLRWIAKQKQMSFCPQCYCIGVERWSVLCHKGLFLKRLVPHCWKIWIVISHSRKPELKTSSFLPSNDGKGGVETSAFLNWKSSAIWNTAAYVTTIQVLQQKDKILASLLLVQNPIKTMSERNLRQWRREKKLILHLLSTPQKNPLTSKQSP